MVTQAACGDDDRVSVIIVNWNGERYLARCLAALQAQTHPPAEILLVDNASTDGSLAVIRQFPAVRLLAQDHNTGFAQGNNLALAVAAASSNWIALLNPDAFAEPEWLAALLQAARQHRDCAVFASCQLDAADPQRLDGVGDAYHISGLPWRKGYGRRRTAVDDQAREIFSACAAAALYRRDALQAVGGFDEDYFCYVEDVDLGFRLRLAGHACRYVPTAIVHHVGSATTGGQHSDFALYHGHRNLVWTFFKDMPAPLFWPLLPLHLALNLFSLVWFARQGHGRVLWRAKRDALRGLPAIWRKRQAVQRERRIRIGALWRLLEKGVRRRR